MAEKDTAKYLTNGDPDVSLNRTDTPVYTAMHSPAVIMTLWNAPPSGQTGGPII